MLGLLGMAPTSPLCGDSSKMGNHRQLNLAVHASLQKIWPEKSTQINRVGTQQKKYNRLQQSVKSSVSDQQ